MDTILHHDTITLFSRYPDAIGDTWTATVITNAHISHDKAMNQANIGETQSENLTISVPINGGKIANKAWKANKEWMKSSSDTREETITVKSGRYFDVILVGEWTGSETVSDSDYTTGFYDYLRKNNDYVYAVTSVSGPFKFIPHINISAR